MAIEWIVSGFDQGYVEVRRGPGPGAEQVCIISDFGLTGKPRSATIIGDKEVVVDMVDGSTRLYDLRGSFLRQM